MKSLCDCVGSRKVTRCADLKNTIRIVSMHQSRNVFTAAQLLIDHSGMNFQYNCPS